MRPTGPGKPLPKKCRIRSTAIRTSARNSSRTGLPITTSTTTSPLSGRICNTLRCRGKRGLSHFLADAELPQLLPARLPRQTRVARSRRRLLAAVTGEYRFQQRRLYHTAKSRA